MYGVKLHFQYINDYTSNYTFNSSQQYWLEYSKTSTNVQKVKLCLNISILNRDPKSNSICEYGLSSIWFDWGPELSSRISRASHQIREILNFFY